MTNRNSGTTLAWLIIGIGGVELAAAIGFALYWIAIDDDPSTRGIDTALGVLLVIVVALFAAPAIRLARAGRRMGLAGLLVLTPIALLVIAGQLLAAPVASPQSGQVLSAIELHPDPLKMRSFNRGSKTCGDG